MISITMAFLYLNNKQVTDSRILSKIDHVLGNVLLEEVFPHAIVSFLPEGTYDHSPMLIQVINHHRGKNTF